MKLREEEFYEQYHQHGGTTIIPTEIFNELYDDATEEIERLNNDIKELLKENENKEKVIKAQDNIIKEVRGKLYDLNYKIKEIHNVPFDISEIFEMIEILDKEKE